MKMLFCKRAVAGAWFALGGLAVLVLVGQTVTERYGARVADVWTWFSIFFLPAATVAFYAVTVGARDSNANQYDVPFAEFAVTFVLSLFYLGLILAPILYQPFAQEASPFETLNRWAAVLGVFQSIVAGSLASLFIRP
jgi:cytochrome bd-type quinol oxidase subunit 2